MCDIYSHVCDEPGCSFNIPMHLEDYATGRNEIEVFCGSHIPEDKADGVLWKYKEGKSWSYIFVRALTHNAKAHWRGNCYNGVTQHPIKVFGDKPTTK